MSYLERSKQLPFYEITIGYTTIHLFSEDEIADGQVGYSVDSNGNSLVGKENGDWKKNWLVIGYEDLCGDPIFIDINATNLPVYTAEHGTGHWTEKLIADNFESFITSLSLVKNSKSSDKTLKDISNLNKKADLEFWELLFED